VGEREGEREIEREREGERERALVLLILWYSGSCDVLKESVRRISLTGNTNDKLRGKQINPDFVWFIAASNENISQSDDFLPMTDIPAILSRSVNCGFQFFRR
jgi:hypothetical protein